MISFPNFSVRAPRRAQAARKARPAPFTAKEQVDLILLALAAFGLAMWALS